MKLRDENKVQSIFQATLQLTMEKGVAGININEVAKKASLATGTVYIYFKSKDNLINELFTTCKKESAEAYFHNYKVSKSFKTDFKTIWLNLFTFRIKHFEKTIFLEQCYHSPFISETTKEMTKQLFQPLYQLIDRGKKELIIKNMDSFLLLAFMISSINEVAKRANYTGKKLTKETINNLFLLCWDGLKK